MLTIVAACLDRDVINEYSTSVARILISVASDGDTMDTVRQLEE